MAFGLGSILPSVLSAGIGLLGSSRGQSRMDDYAQQALQATRPLDVRSPLGSAVFSRNDLRLRLPGAISRDISGLRGLRGDYFGLLNDPNFIQTEVDRLRGIARPNEDALRASLRSRLFNQGRLGLGVGNGMTGGMFNPELAALEEGFARADAGRVDQARGEQQRLLGNVFGLLGQETDLRALPLQAAQIGIQARTPSSALGPLYGAQQYAGRANDAFFGGLGSILSGLAGRAGGASSALSAADFSLPFGILGLR